MWRDIITQVLKIHRRIKKREASLYFRERKWCVELCKNFLRLLRRNELTKSKWGPLNLRIRALKFWVLLGATTKWHCLKIFTNLSQAYLWCNAHLIILNSQHFIVNCKNVYRTWWYKVHISQAICYLFSGQRGIVRQSQSKNVPLRSKWQHKNSRKWTALHLSKC